MDAEVHKILAVAVHRRQAELGIDWPPCRYEATDCHHCANKGNKMIFNQGLKSFCNIPNTEVPEIRGIKLLLQSKDESRCHRYEIQALAAHGLSSRKSDMSTAYSSVPGEYEIRGYVNYRHRDIIKFSPAWAAACIPRASMHCVISAR